jgi:phosphoribosylglycinamide formyltransferase-1
MAKLKVGVLISGRGSNMASLVRAAWEDDYPAEIACVISNVADAPGVKIAKDAGIATAVIPHGDYPDRETFERAMTSELDRHGVRLVALAGFMRVLSPWFPQYWQGRIVNIHPSLLPAFKGLNVHQKAIDAGARVSGCTVHFVVPELDGGPIIAQAAVRVLAGDTADRLATRILQQEHRLYPLVVRWFAEGRLSQADGRVEVAGVAPGATLLFSDEP